MDPDPPPPQEAFNIRDLTQPRQGHQGQQAQQAQQGLPLLAPRPRRNGGVAEQVMQHPRLLAGGCCLALLALTIVLLVSLGTVAPTEYGLRYNRITKSVDKSYVYHGGRHIIGPFSNLLIFPATVQTLEFSNRSSAKAEPLTTRTQEGLTLHLHVAFQYHLRRSEVSDLYHVTNMFYEPLYMKIARDVLLKAAANYNAPQYWTERHRIGQDMFDLVNKSLSGSHASCTGLQLLLIELPQTYEDSIVATQVQKQDIKTQENKQKASLIRAQIKVMVADYEKQITVIINGANANATLATKVADARSQQMRIDAENIALEQVKAKLGLSPEAMVGYQRNFAYTAKPNATFLFGLSNAVAVLGGGASATVAPAPPPHCAAAEEPTVLKAW